MSTINNEQNRTDSLNDILINYCKNNEEKKLILSVMQQILDCYQWNYQNASDKIYRNVYKTNMKAIKLTIALLIDRGDNSLAEQVKYRLSEEVNSKSSMFTKSKILSFVKKDMKDIILARNIINESVYKNTYSARMEEAFLEQCKEHPLTEVPEHFDSDFEPPYL